MKYYEIIKKAEIGICYTYPVFVVENEEVAKDICMRYPAYFYEVRDTEGDYR